MSTYLLDTSGFTYKKEVQIPKILFNPLTWDVRESCNLNDSTCLVTRLRQKIEETI